MVKSNFRIQKKHLAFFTVVPLLLATALVRVPCPVCNGTGSISNTGMDQVRVMNVTSSLKDTYLLEGCLNYRIYNFNVTVTLQNDSPDRNAKGFVILVLVDKDKSRKLDEQLVVGEVPARSSIETSYTVSFLTMVDDPIGAAVDAGVLKGAVTDQVCGGTGKVALNSWPLYQATVNSLVETQRIEVNFQPRELTPSEIEELIGQEGSTDQWYEEHGDTIYY